MYTVYVNMKYCEGLFETEELAEQYANELVIKEGYWTKKQTQDFDEDDWWNARDNANISILTIYEAKKY